MKSTQHYSPEGNGKAIYFLILTMLQTRIAKAGHIATADAWDICRGKYSYTVVGIVFKRIMDEEIKADRAQRIKPGRYIVRPAGMPVNTFRDNLDTKGFQDMVDAATTIGEAFKAVAGIGAELTITSIAPDRQPEPRRFNEERGEIDLDAWSKLAEQHRTIMIEANIDPAIGAPIWTNRANGERRHVNPWYSKVYNQWLNL